MEVGDPEIPKRIKLEPLDEFGYENGDATKSSPDRPPYDSHYSDQNDDTSPEPGPEAEYGAFKEETSLADTFDDDPDGGEESNREHFRYNCSSNSAGADGSAPEANYPLLSQCLQSRATAGGVSGQNTSSSADSAIWQCTQRNCTYFGLSMVELQEHMAKSHPKKPTNVAKSPVYKPTFFCHVCSYSTADKSNFRRHQRTHDSSDLVTRKLTCHLCEYTTVYSSSLTKHMTRVHKRSKDPNVLTRSQLERFEEEDGAVNDVTCTPPPPGPFVQPDPPPKPTTPEPPQYVFAQALSAISQKIESIRSSKHGSGYDCASGLIRSIVNDMQKGEGKNGGKMTAAVSPVGPSPRLKGQFPQLSSILVEDLARPVKPTTNDATVCPCKAGKEYVTKAVQVTDSLEEPPKINKDTLKEEEYRCTFCGITFSDYVIHSLHMGCHSHSDPYTCNVCGKVCSNKYGFYCHIMRGHSN